MLFGCLMLSACQSTPLTPKNPAVIPSSPVITSAGASIDAATSSADTDDLAYNEIYDESVIEDDASEEYPLEPYIPPQTTVIPANSRQSIPDATIDDSDYSNDYEPAYEEEEPSYPIPRQAPIQSQAPAMPSHSELLERARQNSQQQASQTASDNSSLPAFRNLMQVGVNQLKSGQLTAAENSFTRAQRLAPKSSAVYFYLAQVALKKQQPRKAEAMARRGLVVSQNASRRRALWQIILMSGQAQNSSRVIKEAQQALR